MKIINLSEGNSLLNQYVAELRDVHVQNDRMRFRRNIERIGEIMAYEILGCDWSSDVCSSDLLLTLTCKETNNF